MLHGAVMSLASGSMDQHLASIDLSSEGSTHSFNLGNMIFLPKKASGTHPLLGEYYSPGDVRPLVVVNSDNRLIANLYRRQWEPIFENRISDMQQGFLPGRSMASNIVEIECDAQLTSVSCSRGGLILLDFRAAFLGVSQEFLHRMPLHRMLELLNVPQGERWVVENLYCSRRCNICFEDLCEDGFSIGTGIRQGCPLSPLLFAFIVDDVLRRVKDKIPSATVRAFADDIALVVKDVDEALPILQEIFGDLEGIANLCFNKRKCVLIPLWLSDPEQIEREILAAFPDLAGLQVAYSGTYLGVDIGPDGVFKFWAKAIKKFS